jgi:pimeloyl-ACP methyl ester carboxylesterase
VTVPHNAFDPFQRPAEPNLTAPLNAPITPLDAWRDAGTSFLFKGHRIFFRHAPHAKAGAPALLLLHGFPTASWDWSKCWDALSARFTLLAPDMLGFGFSAKPRAHEYRIADQADMLEALCAHLKISRAHLLAHDVGDTVAQELLARMTEGKGLAIESACLLNGGLFPETHRPRLIQRLLLSPLGPWVARRITREKFGGNMKAIFGAATQPDDAELDILWQLATHNDGLAAYPRLIRYMKERRHFRARWVGALQQTAVPVRLIAGSDDPISGAHMVRRYHQLIPDADVVGLSGVGHYPQLEAPGLVLRAFFAFHDTRVSTPPHG